MAARKRTRGGKHTRVHVPESPENLSRTYTDHYEPAFWQLVNTRFADVDGEEFWPETSLTLAANPMRPAMTLGEARRRQFLNRRGLG